MRIAQINLPTHDNEGFPLVAETDMLRHMLLDVFGGFTETSGNGVWRDGSNGTIYREPVTVFQIACPDTLESAGHLRSMAGAMAREARQVCVFLVLPSGAVEFVEPVKLEA
ncbi:hypothetical protein [Microcystis phage Mwe-JY26]